MPRHSLRTPPPGSTVLMARFSAIGDVAMTVPVVYSACRCWPDRHFVLLTRPSMVPIFVGAPANLSVVGVDLKDTYAGVAGIRRLAAMCRRTYAPHVFVDLHNVLRTRLLAIFLRMHGVRSVRIDKARGSRRALTRPHNKVMLPLPGSREAYADAFRAAGMPLQECFDGLFPGPRTAPEADFAAITAPRAPGKRWVGIAPFAAHPQKIYPTARMQSVVADLAARPDIEIFLFGGGDAEAAVLQPWTLGRPNVHCLAGRRYGFAAELALLNHLDCMLTMDSGNMHLAAIAGTPTLSIWGATHPYCGFAAWRQSDADTIQLPVPCRPCSVFGNRPCRRRDLMCLDAIRPAAVVARVLEKLPPTAD